MQKTTAININLSTTGARLGGAAIAAEFHSLYMADIFPVELWRMWNQDESFYSRNLKITHFDSQPKLQVASGLYPKRLRSLLLDSKILSKLEIESPQIVHLHNPLPSFAFANIVKTASRSGIKVVASTHGFYEVMHPNYGLNRVEKFLWKKTVTEPILNAIDYLDAICSLYPNERDMLVDLGVPSEKILLTPNGVNPFFLTVPTSTEQQESIDKFNLSTDKPIMLFIGNHTANKGIDTVMKVSSTISQACTIIVGGKLLTPDEPQQWQTKFPSNDNVRVIFTDYLTTTEQRSLYYLADILLYPSLADTLPLTIIEAMACELPVIAYDVGGIAYQLDENCGKVVASGNFEQFLATTEDLLIDEAKRKEIAANAKNRQEQIFAWEKTAVKTIELYQKLLESD
jgi:alpha-maltose-1-phosphate synthase